MENYRPSIRLNLLQLKLKLIMTAIHHTHAQLHKYTHTAMYELFSCVYLGCVMIEDDGVEVSTVVVCNEVLGSKGALQNACAQTLMLQ